MARRKVKAGITSVQEPIFVQNTSSTTGAGLSGLTFSTASMVAEYRGELDSAWTSVSLVTKTLGTYVSGGFIVDGGLAGAYAFDPPNACFASARGRWVNVRLYGATNMFPVELGYELDAIDYQDGVRAGLTSLPNAAAGASGGLLISGSNAGTTTFAALTVIGTFAVSDGLSISRSSSNADGISVSGNGSGSAIKILGGATGNGLQIAGGLTSGDGISVSTTIGHGFNIAASGTSKHGIFVTGGTAGTSDGIKAIAGTGGVDIRGNIAGNLTGNVSGSVASVTGAVVLPSIPANWITAGGINAAALNGKGDWATATALTPIQAKTDLIATNAGDSPELVTGLGTIGTNLNATVGSRSTYAGADTAGTTTLLTRLPSVVAFTAGNVNSAPQTSVTVGTNLDKTGYALSAAGLDAISVADPGGVAGMTTFPKMMVALWRWAFKKSTTTATQLKTFADDGTTVNTTATISNDGTTATKGTAS